MKEKKRFSNTQVERVGREILRWRPLRSESPDAVFLAGVRKKLANLTMLPETAFLSVARLSWSLAPVTALATLVLSVGLILERPAPGNLPEEPWERVLTEIADDLNAEVSQDLLVEAIFLGSGGR